MSEPIGSLKVEVAMGYDGEKIHNIGAIQTDCARAKSGVVTRSVTLLEPEGGALRFVKKGTAP